MRGRLFTIITMACMAGATSADARNWVVNPDGSGDAPTIQAAIDSAAAGDAVLVTAGRYSEDEITVDGKDLMISYSGGNVYLDSPTPGSGTAFILRGVSFATLIIGFTIRDYEIGILVENASPTFWFGRLEECGTGMRTVGASSAPDFSFNLVDSCSTGIEIADGTGVHIKNQTIVNCGIGVVASGGTTSLIQSILYGCVTGLQCSGGAVDPSCNDFWNNGTDRSGCSPGPSDLALNPIFCFEAPSSPGPYYLDEASPCFAANNPCGKNLGTFTTIPGCSGTAVEGTSWGGIKRLFH